MAELVIDHSKEWAVFVKFRNVLLPRREEADREQTVEKFRKVCAVMGCRKKDDRLDGLHNRLIAGVQFGIQICLITEMGSLKRAQPAKGREQ